MPSTAYCWYIRKEVFLKLIKFWLYISSPNLFIAFQNSLICIIPLVFLKKQEYFISFGALRWLIYIWQVTKYWFEQSEFKKSQCVKGQVLCALFYCGKVKSNTSAVLFMSIPPPHRFYKIKRLRPWPFKFHPAFRRTVVCHYAIKILAFCTFEIPELITGSWDQTIKKLIPNLQYF